MSGHVVTDEELRLVGRVGTAACPPHEATDREAVLVVEPSPFAPQKGRAFVTRACAAWGVSELAETAALVANELVTNVVVHARTPLELHLHRRAEGLLVAVHDRDPAYCASWWNCQPGQVVGDGKAGGARYGLNVVKQLADRCGGYEHPAGGKVMWAAITQAYVAPPAEIDLSGREREQNGPGEAVQHRVVVSLDRTSGRPSMPEWRLELVLGCRRQDPDWVDLTLRATPRHPALPDGHWRVRRETLATGLQQPAGDASVHVAPSADAPEVVVRFEGQQPQLIRLSCRDLAGFLDASDFSPSGDLERPRPRPRLWEPELREAGNADLGLPHTTG